ncbi:MAG: thiamine pyrophosphate-dependent enzyme [Patescibacteria group bacterium]|nr:thiamine pyrophosphate-dependent enzyme [Patescibacteria group bacterium]
MNYQTKITPTWCPGCGNFGIFAALKQALLKKNIKPHEISLVYDVGCSGNMADFVYSYGFHGLHGRTLPVAAGIKLANHNLPVIAIIGDGGCFGEGLSHFISLARGNHDILVITHDNYLYSLTTGQMSPISKKGTITPSTPFGSIEEPFNQIGTAVLNHATFVARGFSGNIPNLTDLIIKGLDHQGYAFLDVLQPCITYNKDMTPDWYRKHIYELAKNYDPTNKKLAIEKSQETDKLPTGIFYQINKPTFHQQILDNNQPLVKKDISSINIKDLL